MPNVLNEFAGDGVTRTFNFSMTGGYLSRDFVVFLTRPADALLDYTPYTGTVVWVSDFTVEISDPIPVGTVFVITRRTPAGALIDFQNTSRITEQNLDTAFGQGLHRTVELDDLTERRMVAQADLTVAAVAAAEGAERAAMDSADFASAAQALAAAAERAAADAQGSAQASAEAAIAAEEVADEALALIQQAIKGNVDSFNGRDGAVVPRAGDYTPEQVGFSPGGTITDTPGWAAVPAWTSNSHGQNAAAQALADRTARLKADQQLLKQRADKSMLSYPNYAAASAAAATLPDGQTVKSPDSSGRLSEFAVVSGALVFNGYAANVVSAVNFDSVADFFGSSLVPGDKAVVGSTAFLIVGDRPASGAYPVIPAGSGYAVPVKNHTARRYGATAAKGQVTSADWQTSASRSNQGIELDNRAGTLLVSSLNSAAVPQTGKLIEYSYSASGIGAEVMRTGELPIGHSEYFAIVYDADGQRYVWAGDDATKTIRKVKLITGATVADTVQSVSVASQAASVTVNVFGYDHEHIAVWLVGADGKDAIYICRISDMDAGIFAPVKSLDTPSVGRVWSLFPGQMLRAVGGIFAGLSGGRADTPTTASAGWYDVDAGDVVAKIPMDWATAGSEVEGLSFYWNAAVAKFETHASIWYGSTGQIEFYSLTDANAAVSKRQSAHAFLKERYTSGGVNLIPAQSGTSGMRYSSQAPVAIPALHIGGDRRNVGPFDPNDFYIAQHNHISEGRESAVIRFKGMECRFDGPNDPVIGPGYRYLTANTSGVQKDALQVLPFGIKVGNSRTNASTAPKFAADLQANEEVDGGVYVSTPTTSRPSFVGSSVYMTYATTFTDMYFGNYNLSTKTSTLWWYLNGTRLRPANDNATDIGTSGHRVKDLFLVNAPTVTSDGNEKSRPESIPDAWLDAWGEVESLAWQWLESVAKKEDRARIHTGPIAQKIRDAFVRHGVMQEDSTDCPWGGLCHSDYGDDLGPDAPEVGRWGIRADQCHFLEAAYQRRRADRIEARLTAIEAKLQTMS